MTSPGRTVAIVQSNYIPWKGYFDLIARSDEFILYDDAQFTRRDWRNRNRIKTAQGLQWLSIPVESKGKYTARICDMTVAEPGWNRAHWSRIAHAYAKAPYFPELKDALEDAYARATSVWLSEINHHFLTVICGLLSITTPLTNSSRYELTGDPTDKLLGMCLQAGATTYLSGPAARDYLDTTRFESRGLQVEWMDYSGYPEYPQLYPPFEHGVSVLDLLFSVGLQARQHLSVPLNQDGAR